MAQLSADDLISLLGLEPHPEGGHFRRTFRDPQGHDGRAHSTAIYYFLRRGERSHWHRLDVAEVWHFYAGAPLTLRVVPEGEAGTSVTLGADLVAGERPQALVPQGAWQSAESLGEWTLVGCTVAPGFETSGFELAPPGWEPDS